MCVKFVKGIVDARALWRERGAEMQKFIFLPKTKRAKFHSKKRSMCFFSVKSPITFQMFFFPVSLDRDENEACPSYSRVFYAV